MKADRFNEIFDLGYPVHSGTPNSLWLSVDFFDQLAIGGRRGEAALEEALDEKPAAG